MSQRRYKEVHPRATVQLLPTCLDDYVGPNNRQLGRWEHEAVMDRHRTRMAKGREVMRMRGALVEHPFGTLKRWAGFEYFLIRGLVKCRGEWNLMTLCYNFKRVLSEVKIDVFIAYCQARQEAQGIGM